MKITQNYLVENYTKTDINTFNEGEILTGIIQSSDEDGKVCVNLSNNYTLKFDKSEIVGDVGENVTFTVVQNKNNSISLTQLDIPSTDNVLLSEEASTEYSKSQTLVPNNTIKQSNTSSYIKVLQKTKSNTYESNLSIKKTKESISYLSKTLGEMALKSLTEMGLNTEKLDVEKTSTLVEKALGEDTSEEALEEDIKVNINKLGITEEEYYKYANILARFNLPITPENLLNLKSVDNKLDEITALSENTVLDLIKSEGSINLQDLYVSKYSTLNNINNDEKVYELGIENLDDLIKNLFDKQEIEFNEENLQLAKKFISNEIEISKENFEKYKMLSNIQDFIDKDYILENSALNIIKNKNIDSLEIFETESSKIEDSLKETYINTKETLENITTQDIQSLINKNIPINLQNVINEYNLKTEDDSQVIISEKAISEKLKIARIQMKLTQEAILRLAQTNIDITTKPLQEAIEQLEAIELNIYEENLKIVGAEVSSVNLQNMKNTMTAIENIYPTNVYNTFGKIINSEIEFSLEGINNEVLNTNSEKILKTLEIFETTKNASFGDTISKLNGQFENLLKNNNLEVNEANLKAVKILSLNNIDFDENILTQVKTIDNKINYIHDKLHPLAVAEIIKKGINPTTENIDDLINIIDEVSSEYSQTSREKIAEYILEMDKEGTISDEERKAIISFYRMLNLIEKNGSASIGTLLKNDGRFTLKNLMEASSLYQKQKRNIDFDRKIDDNFGEVEEMIIPENNINNAIKNAVNTPIQDEYNDILVKRIIDYATPETIQKVFNNLRFKDMLLEEILDEIKLGEEPNNAFMSEQTIKAIADKIRNLDVNDKATLNWLIKNNIPVTIANIENMRDAIKGNFNPAKNIMEFNDNLEENQILPIDVLSSKIDDSIENSLDFAKNIEDLENKTDETFDEIINLENFTDITTLLLQNKLLKEKLSFNKAINKIENGVYQIPIKLQNNTVTNLNMYILNPENLNTKDSLNLFLSLETKNIGNVQVYITLQNEQINLKISSNSANGLQKLKSYVSDFEKALSQDFDNFNITFEQEESTNIYSNNFENEFKTKIEVMSNEFNAII